MNSEYPMQNISCINSLYNADRSGKADDSFESRIDSSAGFAPVIVHSENVFTSEVYLCYCGISRSQVLALQIYEKYRNKTI